LHQSVGKLICHHCGYQLPVPPACPKCKAEQIRHYGIGTEQLEVFLRQRFSATDVIRIDRDTVTARQTLEHKMQPVRSGKPCILVGTQMLAKGHDYPHITLVGILDADQALYSSFYRAAERLVQTVLQVSGRAGRAEKEGQALLQTAFPSHPLMQGLCHQSYTELAMPMLDERKLLGFPPYVRVVTLQVDALDLEPAMQRLRQLRQALLENVQQPEIKVIGPIPALMTRRVGRFRAQLSVLAPTSQDMRYLLQRWMPSIEAIKNTAQAHLTIEVDPLDL
jgi:primosomal protein N' (replication factor Y)